MQNRFPGDAGVGQVSRVLPGNDLCGLPRRGLDRRRQPGDPAAVHLPLLQVPARSTTAGFSLRSTITLHEEGAEKVRDLDSTRRVIEACIGRCWNATDGAARLAAACRICRCIISNSAAILAATRNRT